MESFEGRPFRTRIGTSESRKAIDADRVDRRAFVSDRAFRAGTSGDVCP
jgi:hypothetical protein